MLLLVILMQIGGDVGGFHVGDRVGAITTYGGYSEYVYWPSKYIFRVPTGVNPAEAVTLILNYLVAYQTLHRTANVKAGDKVLIVGASGGIGTAYLQLGKLAGLQLYGIASKRKHHILTDYDCVPIDYHTEDFVDVIQQAEPTGLDFVFDGMGNDYVKRGLPLLRRGGMWVGYGNPGSFTGMLRVLWQMIYLNLLPNGKRFRYYGAGAWRFDMKPFQEDWDALFKLLETEQIKPVICDVYPILEAANANAYFESGDVVGHVVLVAPHLLENTKQNVLNTP